MYKSSKYLDDLLSLYKTGVLKGINVHAFKHTLEMWSVKFKISVWETLNYTLLGDKYYFKFHMKIF